MDSQAFSQAKACYQRADWAGALAALNAAKAPGEVSGEVDHLRGNAFMKLGMYAEAAEAYGSALADAAYGHTGALNCNRGRAYVAAGRPDVAVGCFEAAVADPTYATPYKAHLALGNLYSRQGMAREAGVAWRNAAIDESNPDPASALVKLGGCFMTLSRPVDAVEAYRTALDFSSDAAQGPIYADLGQAYMATNRLSEAVDAFTKATADGTYQLTAEQMASLSAAQKALSAVQGPGPSETDQLLAGYGSPSGGAGVDPLDPMGKSGEFIPSPEDTGFFSVTEEDLMQADKKDRKMRRKHSHRGRKVLVVILLLLAIVCGTGAFAYYKGYGWPMQETVISDLFGAASNGDSIDAYVSEGLSDDARSQISAVLPKGQVEVKVSGITRQTTTTDALVTATLSAGGSQNYSVSLVRDGLGWKVTSVELSFASQASSTTTSTGVLDTSSSDGTSASTGEVAPSTSTSSTTSTAGGETAGSNAVTEAN